MRTLIKTVFLIIGCAVLHVTLSSVEEVGIKTFWDALGVYLSMTVVFAAFYVSLEKDN